MAADVSRICVVGDKRLGVIGSAIPNPQPARFPPGRSRCSLDDDCIRSPIVRGFAPSVSSIDEATRVVIVPL